MSLEGNRGSWSASLRGPVRLTVLAFLLIGLVLVPAGVLALGRYGWAGELGLGTLEVGLFSMIPGLLLGAGAGLVMLGSS